MSFVPDFAPDAKSQWLELEVDIQELVLDEMEKLAQNPPRRAVIYHDFFHEHQGIKHNVFLRITIDHSRRRLTVIGIKHVKRQSAP